MNKNLILAVVLSSLVYIGWYSFMEKRLPKPQPAQQAQGAQPGAAAQPAAQAAQAEPAPLPADWKQKAVKLTAGKAEYTFNAETASLVSAVYQGPVAPVELVPDPQRGFLYTSFPGTFSLKAKTDRSAEFVSQQGPIRVTKKFTLTEKDGITAVEIRAVNTSGSPQSLPPWELRLGPGLDTVKSEMKENEAELKAVYTFQESGRKHPTLKEVEDDEPAQNDWVWAGLSNRYFLAAFADPSFKTTRPLRRDEKVGKIEKTPVLAVPMPGSVLRPGETVAWTTLFYLGPKDLAVLRELGLGLDRSVDFGFFAPLAKFANSSLIYFHKLTGNYGIAIIILSVIIQILLTPLSFKSYKAMAVMKKIQPEMQSIQKMYKDDPQRMNREVMDLYKRHGTNPLGGCLPMLLQIPVFFALFTALRNSWSLHGAPFFLWIKDLSSKDPFYVLPLVMGGIMFLQQHLSPQTSDPAQAAMMKWMPVIFTFMFLSFPSGLVLYWLINSTWGFAQSMYLQKKMG
ncbi:MAG: hypothetical protein A2X32_07960 [Elusimicrobia bacterium GWC2_64_44]|nr:MAG: hypothetical protein A2X32_07960 [Elusimicrobia bacterium GWC2_64_44]